MPSHVEAKPESRELGTDILRGETGCGGPSSATEVYLVNMLPIDGRAKHIVRIIVIIIGILSLLKYLGVWL